MSFLLDALRKSEGRRRPHEVPTIHAGVGGEPPSTRRSRWPWAVVILPPLMVMTWFGWRQFGVLVSSPEAPQATMAEPAPAPAGPVTIEQEAASPRVDDPRDGPRTPVEQLAGPGLERSPVSAPAARLEPGAQRAPSSAGPAPERVAEVAPPAPAEQPAAEARERQPSPISYWELPSSVRQDLPEFKISVLVYADHPEDRFILLNGRRQTEGDEFQPGLVLQEIRRDGAVFSYRLYRFLVRR